MAIHIFTRDLRIKDNKSLNALHDSYGASEIYPIFIFNDDQVKVNKYKSENAIQFMVDSLFDLNVALKNKLGVYCGTFSDIVKKLVKTLKPEVISITKDYTPYSKRREKKLIDICGKNKIKYIITEDYCLNNPGSVKLYQKFTPYKNAVLKKKVPDVPKNYRLNFAKLKGNFSIEKASTLFNKNLKINREGGRGRGLRRMMKIKNHKKYDTQRNDLDKETTELSPYIKFGCLSIREVYWAIADNIGHDSPLISQLIWRDFYYQLGYYFPKVLKGYSLKEKYDKIKWGNDKSKLKKWKVGETGFPIVDAGMRQLNTTGFMHNRARLITASFLVKVLLIDWKIGEQYYASKLYDYDPLVNNGNWQWVSSSGADSQPYFRIFNPWLQSKKHDPECKYIKKWVPELKNVKPNIIHTWYKKHDLFEDIYIKPMVDFSAEKKVVVDEYKKLFNK